MSSAPLIPAPSTDQAMGAEASEERARSNGWPMAVPSSGHSAKPAGDADRHVQFSDDVTPDDGVWEEVREMSSSLQEPMRKGAVGFAWKQGQHVKRVPYFIVPDSWARDPAFVERVVDGLGLKMPNLVLNFNPIKQPISRWNKEWDYSSPAADSIWEVDEDILPLELPLGQSTSVTEVAQYMATVVEDRIVDVLGGVAAACAQAKAWLRVTGAGMSDYAPQILSKAADKNSVILSIYCMEDFASPSMTGGSLDPKNFSEPGGVQDRVPGGKDFCKALHDFSGLDNDDEPSKRPRTFVENIDEVMEMFDKMRIQTVKPKEEYFETGRGKKKKREKRWVKKQEKCVEQLNAFFKHRAYLPAKDITHLLVFQSRKACDAFKMMLDGRVASCNFLMEGSTEAMQMFDFSMKTGTPVFIMRGTGGASNKIHLVLEHMRYRKELELRGHDDSDSDEDNAGADEGAVGCLGFSRARSKVVPADNAQEAYGKAGAGAEDENGNNVDPNGLVALKTKIETHMAQFEDTIKDITDEGDLFEKLDKQNRIMWLREMKLKAEELQQTFEALMDLDKEHLADKRDTADQLQKDLINMHSEVDIISTGFIDWNSVEAITHPERTADGDQNAAQANGELSDAQQTAATVINSKVLHLHYKPLDGDAGAAEDERKNVTQTTVLARVDRPEELYERDLKLGRAGIKFESKLGCEYLGPNASDYNLNEMKKKGRGKKELRAILDDVPDGWKLPDEYDSDCERGTDENDELSRVPCKSDTCPECARAKKRERRWLRKIGGEQKSWEDLPLDMHQKYINYWMEANPLSHNDRDVLDPEHKIVAKHARTTFSNVQEPPIQDACVVIDILQVELNIEDIMDDVTSAMSIDALNSEVGEKTAFRRRLLEAWKMVHQLKFNAQTHYWRQHLFNALIIAFTWISVVFGTVTYEMKEGSISEENTTPRLYGLQISPQVFQILEWLNLGFPMFTSLFLALNAAFSPSSKFTALYHQALFVESEIYKVRTRTGDYSPHAASAAKAQVGKDSGDGENSGDKKDTGARLLVKNPRVLFAERMDAVWTDLGASEVRQESLSNPKNQDLVDLNRTIRVQQHPALFEEGSVLLGGNASIKREILERFSYEVEDDGLKVLSTGDYVDLRVMPYEDIFAKRAQALCTRQQWFQFVIFILTSASTFLGATAYMQWIPVALALGSVFSSISAYQELESRMERTNNAIVSLRKLLIWWHGLSVIEKRIPANKTALVFTMESIIQAEAGSVLVNATGSSSDQSSGAGEGGADDKGGGNK